MNVLCVFARTLAPGTGKSRLRKNLPDFLVDELAQAFLLDILNWSRSGFDKIILAYDGSPKFLPELPPQILLFPQDEGSFGTRIQQALNASFALGASRVVMVGSDSPSLPAALLSLSFSALDAYSSTIVPAFDGGWIALGLSSPLETPLQRVAWGTDSAGDDTLRALKQLGHETLVLPAWYDIDEVSDFNLLTESVKTRAPKTRAAFASRLFP